MVLLSGFFNWFLFLEEHVASLMLNLIQEPEELSIFKNSLNAGTQLVSGNLSGILSMEGCGVAKTGLYRSY